MMKTDRELLELAAKAAGVQGRIADEADCFHFYPDEPDKFGTTWAPLTDDGDALRLAVKLHLDIRFYWDGRDDQYDTVEAYTHGAKKDGQTDENAATRRAIVRAAAAIGETMQ